MPKIKQNNDGRFSVSYATIAAVGGILVIVAMLWGVGSKIATKADIDSIKSAITPTLTDHEARLRGIELQLAAYFGASKINIPHTMPSAEPDGSPIRHIVLAQYVPPQIPDYGNSSNQSAARQQPYSVPQRTVVVPIEMIVEYGLEPTKGGAYALLGEDGRYYSSDQVLAIMIRILFPERKGIVPRAQKK